MIKIVIIAGSVSDKDHTEHIKAYLPNCSADVTIHYLSAHRDTEKVLRLLREHDDYKHCIFITIAGMSNALSVVVAANTKHIVIACPPFKSIEDYQVDIHSTLRMPKGVPVLTVLTPENCCEAVKRITSSWL
jgi:phosphoribosylaminoimidazole carboxylase PurE protein